MGNRRGSSAVMLAMIFVSLMAAVAGAITISRALVVKSECESFGVVWSKAILSEYDVHLYEDYSVMAYQGSEKSVRRKIDTYIEYSCTGKLDAAIDGSYANLCGYELSDQDNFIKSIKNSIGSNAVKQLISGSTRTIRENSGEEAKGTHIINNSVVLDTLPSRGIGNNVDIGELAESIKNGKEIIDLESAGDIPISLAFMYRYLGSNVSCTDDKPHFFINELEYVLAGNNSDEKNYRECRTKLFVLRNALNLVSLYADSRKVELITAVSEIITPGPVGAATQAVIAELWAAAETEEDLKTLYSGGRVPVVKSDSEWKTGLSGIISSDEFSSKLDEDARKLLNEKRSEIDGKIGESGMGADVAGEISEGQNYDDYLLIMLSAMNGRIRMLRAMDIVQINMKYRYYADFNMEEYYTGVGFTIKANGRDYEINDKYK